MTYDDTAEIRKLAHEFGFKYRRVTMRSKHHVTKKELLISKILIWLKNNSFCERKTADTRPPGVNSLALCPSLFQ